MKILLFNILNVFLLVTSTPINNGVFDMLIKEVNSTCPQLYTSPLFNRTSEFFKSCQNITTLNIPIEQLSDTNKDIYLCLGVLNADLQLCKANYNMSILPKTHEELKDKVHKITAKVLDVTCKEITKYNRTLIKAIEKPMGQLDHYLNNDKGCSKICTDIVTETSELCSLMYFVYSNINVTLKEPVKILNGTNIIDNKKNALELIKEPIDPATKEVKTLVTVQNKVDLNQPLKYNNTLQGQKDLLKVAIPTQQMQDKVEPKAENVKVETKIELPLVKANTELKLSGKNNVMGETKGNDDIIVDKDKKVITKEKVEYKKVNEDIVGDANNMDDNEFDGENKDAGVTGDTDDQAYDENVDDLQIQDAGSNVSPPKNVITSSNINPGRDMNIDQEVEDSNFFSYFMFGSVLFICGYIAYHNKQKILALVLEGRRDRNARRRPNTASYRKLNSNLEEAVTSKSGGSAAHVIY